MSARHWIVGILVGGLRIGTLLGAMYLLGLAFDKEVMDTGMYVIAGIGWIVFAVYEAYTEADWEKRFGMRR